MAGVLVYAEHRDGKFTNSAIEAVSVGYRIAQEMSTDLTAAVVGKDVSGMAPTLGAYGVTRALVVDAPEKKPTDHSH